MATPTMQASARRVAKIIRGKTPAPNEDPIDMSTKTPTSTSTPDPDTETDADSSSSPRLSAKRRGRRSTVSLEEWCDRPYCSDDDCDLPVMCEIGKMLDDPLCYTHYAESHRS